MLKGDPARHCSNLPRARFLQEKRGRGQGGARPSEDDDGGGAGAGGDDIVDGGGDSDVDGDGNVEHWQCYMALARPHVVAIESVCCDTGVGMSEISKICQAGPAVT